MRWLRGVKAHYSNDRATIYHGDCIEVMRSLPDNSVDSIVTDPPYELGFMGKGWDASGIAYNPEVWRNVLRVLKPGGHLLAFGGTRTWHRLAVGIEDAGFEIRDSIAWMYGSGFPKSLDVSKAIDKNNGEVGRLLKFTFWMRTTGLTAKQLDAATDTFMGSHYLTSKSQPAIPTPELWSLIRPLCGNVPEWVDLLVERIAAEREVVGERRQRGRAEGDAPFNTASSPTEILTAPATPEAQKWAGWGTALKPAHEPIVVARKPLIGTVAENVLTHGTGALNIDGSRIGTDGGGTHCNNRDKNGKCLGHDNAGRSTSGATVHGDNSASGRWPANVILDEAMAAELDRQSGVSAGKVGMKQISGKVTFGVGGDINAKRFDSGTTDSGGASRFFYVPKANKNERPNIDETAHPTVKPLTLMRYLCKLVTPPGGTILEPFAGSGTTIEAALMEGFNVIAIEMTDEYLPLIVERIERYGEMLF